MCRIAEVPSSGSLVQCLAKITRMILWCPLTWTRSVLWQHIPTRCAFTVCSSLYMKALQRLHIQWTTHIYSDLHTRTMGQNMLP